MEILTTRVFNNGNLPQRRGRPGHPPSARATRAELMQALQALGEVDEVFIAALQAEREAPLPVQEREGL